mmetsp:Transcript_14847/g.31999  ORF Transcript_14847/g.31999 Transcript_14847/m.31999 type:complete len:642 (+) Transcript_14847:470-2395(+)
MVPNLRNLAHANVNFGKLGLIRTGRTTLLVRRLARRDLLRLPLLLQPLRFLVRSLLILRIFLLAQFPLLFGQIDLVQNISHVHLGPHRQVSQSGINFPKRRGRRVHLFENLRRSPGYEREEQVGHGVDRLQRRTDDHPSLFLELVALELPRLFLREVPVHVSTCLYGHVGAPLQRERLHFGHVRLPHLVEIQDLGIRTGHVRDRPVAVLSAQLRRALDQVPQRLDQVGVVHVPHALLRKAQFSPVRRLLAQIPPEGIDVEEIEHVVWIDDVAHRLGHFLTLLVVDKAVGEDRFGEGEAGGHEDARPDYRVEPEDVLSDDVDVGRPELGQFLVFGPVLVADSERIHAGQVVRQRVEPNVHDVVGVEPLRHRNAMRERRATDAQIPQLIPVQPRQNQIPMSLRSNELGVVFNVLHQPLVILAHTKEVTRLLHLLQRLTRGGIAVVTQFRLVVGDEGLLLDVVPSRVLGEVDVVVGGAAEPEGLGGAFVAGGGGANVVVVGDEGALVEALEAGDVLIANLQRLLPLLLRGLRNLLPVFIRPRHKIRFAGTIPITTLGIQSSKSRNGIGGRTLVRVSHVCWSVGVVDGGGDVESLLLFSFGVGCGSGICGCGCGCGCCIGIVIGARIVAVGDGGWIAEGPSVVGG